MVESVLLTWQTDETAGERTEEKMADKARTEACGVGHLQLSEGQTARDARCGDGHGAQQLKALVSLAEDPRLVSSTHTVAHNHPNSSSRISNTFD